MCIPPGKSMGEGHPAGPVGKVVRANNGAPIHSYDVEIREVVYKDLFRVQIHKLPRGQANPVSRGKRKMRI